MRTNEKRMMDEKMGEKAAPFETKNDASVQNDVSVEKLHRCLREAGYLIQPSALEFLTQCPELLERVLTIANNEKAFIISKAIVEKAVEEAEAEKRAQIVIERGVDYKPVAKEIDAKIRVFDAYDVSGKSRSIGNVEDFVALFRNRYQRIASMLKTRQSANGLVKLATLPTLTHGRRARIIGLVREKRVTKSAHIALEVEDEDTSITCLALKGTAAFEQAMHLVHDEVIALDGRLGSGGRFFIINEITWPDLPIRERTIAEENVSVAFVSDLHIGSRFFLKDAFEKLLRFLNGDVEGNHRVRELIGSIKYILIAGDVIDGVGVYPGQEKQLVTRDVYSQYKIFCNYVANIPEWIHVIVAPGNHDAVRLAEPQPRIPTEFVGSASGLKNLVFVGNPALVELHGFKTLLYHGTSADALIAADPELKDAYLHPEKVAIEMLRRRHLGAIYGEKPITPERFDYLVIEQEPDIFNIGHLHRNSYAMYRGSLAICSGTWQATTDLQLRLGHIPTPGLLSIYNLKSGQVNTMRFA